MSDNADSGHMLNQINCKTQQAVLKARRHPLDHHDITKSRSETTKNTQKIISQIWNWHSKGQLISEGRFWYPPFFQKTNEKIWLNYDNSGRLVFVQFLEEFEDTKKTFRN